MIREKCRTTSGKCGNHVGTIPISSYLATLYFISQVLEQHGETEDIVLRASVAISAASCNLHRNHDRQKA